MINMAKAGKGSSKKRNVVAASDTQARFIEKGLMRARAVSTLTGMPLTDVYRGCHSGIFRFRRMPGGKGILIYRASVEDFIREGIAGNTSSEGAR